MTSPLEWKPAVRDILGMQEDVDPSRVGKPDWIGLDMSYWESRNYTVQGAMIPGQNEDRDAHPWEHWMPQGPGKDNWNQITLYRWRRSYGTNGQSTVNFQLIRAWVFFYQGASGSDGKDSPSKQADALISASNTIVSNIDLNAYLDSKMFTEVANRFWNVWSYLEGKGRAQLTAMYKEIEDGGAAEGEAADALAWAMKDMALGMKLLANNIEGKDRQNNWTAQLPDAGTAIENFKKQMKTAWDAFRAYRHYNPNTLVDSLLKSMESQTDTAWAAIRGTDKQTAGGYESWNFDFKDVLTGGSTTYDLIQKAEWTRLNTDLRKEWISRWDKLDTDSKEATRQLIAAYNTLLTVLSRGVDKLQHMQYPGLKPPDGNGSNEPPPPGQGKSEIPPPPEIGGEGGNAPPGGGGGSEVPSLSGSGGSNGELPPPPEFGGSDGGPPPPDSLLGGSDFGGGPGSSGLDGSGSGFGGSSGIDGPGFDGPGLNGAGIDGSGIDGSGLNASGFNGPGLDGPGLNGVNGPGLDGPGIGGSGANFGGFIGAGAPGLGGAGIGGGGSGRPGGAGAGFDDDLESGGSGGDSGTPAPLDPSELGLGGSGGLDPGGFGSGGDSGFGSGGDSGFGSGSGVAPESPKGFNLGPLGTPPPGYTPSALTNFPAEALAGGASDSGGENIGALPGAMGTPGGGMPFMPPMGGAPGGGKDNEKERERSTWLTEEEDVWGTDPYVTTGVIGREDYEPEPGVQPTRRPAQPRKPEPTYEPTRGRGNR